MRLLDRPDDEKAFNANLAAYAKRRNPPDWFPAPHKFTKWLWSYIDYRELKQAETSKYTWQPPYDIFLTGDKPETVDFRWTFAVHFHYFCMLRQVLAVYDSAVRPLLRREWRSISCGAAFKNKWPKGESAARYTDDNYWALGLEEMFGTEATANARTPEALAGDFNDRTYAISLNCGCDTDVIDWSSDTGLKIALAVSFAEYELFNQLAVIDDDLSRDYGEPYGRCALPLHGPLLDELAANPVYLKKRELVGRIVWFQGDDGLRGWEVEDLKTRKEWTLVLSRFLEPLWHKHEKFKGRRLGVHTVDQVSVQMVRRMTDMDELLQAELSLLLFWVKVLHADFGIIQTDFFSSPRISFKNFSCVAHRGQ